MLAPKARLARSRTRPRKAMPQRSIRAVPSRATGRRGERAGGCAGFAGRPSGIRRTPARSRKRNQAICSHVSPRLDKTLQHHFAPSLVEIDGELVAVHGGDRAGAEFRVKHPRALREGRTRARTRDQFSLDLHRTAARPALLTTSGTALRWLAPALLCALPARRRIERPIGVHIGKTRLRIAAIG